MPPMGKMSQKVCDHIKGKDTEIDKTWGRIEIVFRTFTSTCGKDETISMNKEKFESQCRLLKVRKVTKTDNTICC